MNNKMNKTNNKKKIKVNYKIRIIKIKINKNQKKKQNWMINKQIKNCKIMKLIIMIKIKQNH